MNFADLTANEQKVMLAIAFNDYGEGDCTWAWCIDHSDKPTKLPKRSLGGVVSSLQTKGLLRCEGNGREAAIWVTNEGQKITHALRDGQPC